MSRFMQHLNHLSVMGKVGLAIGVFVAGAVGGTAGVLSTQQRAAQAEQTVAAPQPRERARAAKPRSSDEVQGYTLTGAGDNAAPKHRADRKKRRKADQADAKSKPSRAAKDTADAGATKTVRTVTADDAQPEPADLAEPVDAEPTPDPDADTTGEEPDSGEDATTDGDEDPDADPPSTDGDSAESTDPGAGDQGDAGADSTTGATSTDV